MSLRHSRLTPQNCLHIERQAELYDKAAFG